jgi:hypothetical protein
MSLFKNPKMKIKRALEVGFSGEDENDPLGDSQGGK